MTLAELTAVFVAAVLLHNAEEALWLPQWSTTASRWYPPVGPWEFRFAVAAHSLIVVAVAMLAVHSGPRSASAYIFFGVAFAMTANALIPHLALTFALRRYMPGTVTGLLLNLPLGVSLLREGLSQHWIVARTMLCVAPAVAVALAVTIPVLFAVGRSVAPRPADR